MGARAPADGRAQAHIGVAVSGGRDSTALWHATARLAAEQGQLQVVGLHVHHGLMAQAEDWLRHLRRQARRWAAGGLPVELQWRRLSGAPARGDSTEAWARRGRYAALAAMASEQGIGLVLLAHHRGDQAETFLLQALRGAGPAGLSAMPRQAEREGITWARPWLAQPREAIDAYVRRHHLSFVQDPSNDDTRWARNRLRHTLWPRLIDGFADADDRLSASATRAQEAASCLRELAAMDLQACRTEAGQLLLSPWLALSAARRANLLRAWLSAWSDAGVPDTLVGRLLLELPHARASRWPFARGELRLHRGRLGYAEGSMARPEAPAVSLPIDLSRAGRVEVPQWQGTFEMSPVAQGGLSPERLLDCELRARSGAERFQAAPKALPRGLKKQFQSAGVPAWARAGPLLYAQGQLLYVPALGIDARQLAAPGSPMLGLRWLPCGPDAEGGPAGRSEPSHR